MSKRKLRWFVLPTIYTCAVFLVVLGISFFVNKFNKNYSNYNFATKTMKDNSLPVVTSDGQAGILRPYTDDTVIISKAFYDPKSDEQSQQNSLIFFENTYMENTGVLYSSEKEFDVIAVLDGIVKDIKQDELLGNVIEIEHSNDLVTVYYSVKDIEVNKDDKIVKGQTIAKSGSNKLDSEKENCLLFEVYHKGNLLNPEDFYLMNVDEL